MFFHSISVPHSRKRVPFPQGGLVQPQNTSKKKLCAHKLEQQKTTQSLDSSQKSHSITQCTSFKNRHQQHHCHLRLKIQKIIQEMEIHNQEEPSETCQIQYISLKQQLLHSIQNRSNKENLQSLEICDFSGDDLFLLAMLSCNDDSERFHFLSLGSSHQFNHRECLFECGLSLITGRGVPACTKTGKELLKKCCEIHDYDRAHLELGNLFCEEGQYQKAHQHYTRAVDQNNGSATAWNNLGDLYANGLGVEEDRGLAEQLFIKAARCGHIFALVNLGFLRESDNRIQEAIQFYERAGRQGCSAGFFNLGVIFTKGNEFIEKDLRIAKHYFTLAHELDQDETALEVLRDFDLQLRNESCMGAL